MPVLGLPVWLIGRPIMEAFTQLSIRHVVTLRTTIINNLLLNCLSLNSRRNRSTLRDNVFDAEL